jgi:hypothetical protein
LDNLWSEIDSAEGSNDVVYLQFGGEGYYTGGHSKIRLDEDANYDVSDSSMDSKLDLLESSRVFVSVYACKSGGFRSVCAASGRVIATPTGTSQDTSTVLYAELPWILLDGSYG